MITERDMMKITHVLFDLDGTLTDPGTGITNAIMYSLEKSGMKVGDRADYYPFIGPPLIDSYMNYTGMTKEEAQRAVGYYREYYNAGGMFENKVYDGIPELLMRLKESGKKLVVATSKPDHFAVQILERFGILSYFDFVGAATMDGKRNDKIQVIEHVIKECGIKDPTACIMVGDRKYDVEGAHHFSIPCVSVLFGYGTKEEFEQAGSDYIAGTPEEIEGCIRKAEEKLRVFQPGC